ncbi:MAG TPA: diacylglycerol kinase family protein [Bdellovibrionota bacterium]|nr:diacylglycerol kinase family protein [Bdellovibrionota bacterium]
MASKKVLVVVNPVAGGGRGAKMWAEAKAAVESQFSGATIDVFETTATEHGRGWVAEKLKADRKGEGVVLALGGDGTLSEVARGCYGADGRLIAPGYALGLLPVGRGNDFFKTLAGETFGKGLAPWERGLKLIRESEPKPVDAGLVRFENPDGSAAGEGFLINILDFGFPGLVVDRVMNRKGLVAGKLLGGTRHTYLAQSAAAMLRYKPQPFAISVDGKNVFEGPLFSGMVINGRYNAGGVCWSATADPGDGVFEVLVLKDRGVVDSLKDAPLMKSGLWEKSPAATVTRGREIRATWLGKGSKPHALFDVDGDLPEGPDAVTLVVKTAAEPVRIYRI